MLKKLLKNKVISKSQTHEKDTGSPEVQISLLTSRIIELSTHLKDHKKDFSSRRGLLKMVIQRKRLSNWLKANSPKRYTKLAKTLGL
ncbi:MAG: 30S ribosomal protein S15 [Candidatus Brennerbacteria bacterium RIFOXYC1_FULL_41_11]|uniref:Small ribosomal subunit protein uS15 n=1 Tax=Candidatus Brennerbacteria bacterium RIFOXYD1_FULL_41_16 TaxID=1797529 RepID=A0A1G1XL63_9BACT|nr:MAG: 30S ribosomal protein S15 [Candidatus Brennerbacteria bacterium RIFOXYB1_FULL_41_13]OGY39890.1 MAG: 30S ribosomal protein S15 [Candidatus Brennerbacteria bacterium RIFOXYC1_FULL_41_11]OGY40701.1 MAG: 30S ribosomal protein S15 [Candidatus Brennerbacteria bacterium RIFOXYD1_FULL_41_16]